MTRTTRQLITAAFILIAVTAISLGIRQIRHNIHRARSAADAPVVKVQTPVTDSPQKPSPSDHDDIDHEQDLAWDDSQPSDSQISETQTDTQYAETSDSQYAKTSDADPDDHGKSRSDDYPDSKAMKMAMKESFKGDYGKYSGEKISMQKISVSDGENIFITGDGEHWHVATLPDGTTAKTLLTTDNVDGEVIVTGSIETNVYRSTPKNAPSDPPQK